LWFLAYSSLAVALLVMTISYLVARNGVARPLKAGISVMKRLARGH